jgi:cyclic beta-1,2-glucan synthetase
MYQLLAESFFGLKRTGNRLAIKPCVPDSWNTFEMSYRFSETVYHLKFERDESATQMKLILDGTEQETNDLLLVNDRIVHEVKIGLVTLKAESLKLKV